MLSLFIFSHKRDKLKARYLFNYHEVNQSVGNARCGRHLKAAAVIVAVAGNRQQTLSVKDAVLPLLVSVLDTYMHSEAARQGACYAENIRHAARNQRFLF